MRRAWLAVLLVALPAGAQEAFWAREVVEAAAVRTVPVAPEDALWAQARPKVFRVSAQRSVKLNDRAANALVTVPGAEQLTVRALASPTELALLLEWPDARKDVVRTDEVNAAADSVAFEVPVTFGPGQRLPYVGMGDAAAPVLVGMQRATAEGAVANTYLAAGFGSLTRTTAQVKMAMAFDEAGKVWRAVFVRPLGGLGALTPVAFAVWDGARGERSGYKQLSAWHFVRLPGATPDPAYVKELAWGFAPGELGDPQKGRAIAETVCIACHQLPGKRFAPVGFAPDLSDLGAIATPGYVRDSIVQPSLVLVPSLQPNNHYAKNAAPDAYRAYPNAESYTWSTRDAAGAVVSKMPQFGNLGPAEVADLVAFLMTLDGHVKEAP